MKKSLFVAMVICAVFGIVIMGCSSDGDDDSGLIPTTNGALTITNISTQYNGQYAVFRSSGGTEPVGGDYLLGIADGDIDSLTGAKIENGSVTIPVYLIAGQNYEASSYSGNDQNIKIYVSIKATSTFTGDDVFESVQYVKYTFDGNVNFTGGKATISTTQADQS
jgi:hypothetical protein